IVCTEKGVLAVGENKILLPPCWTRVFCWGFNDFTCCLASSGPDKVMTGESTVDWAGCLCAVCPMPTLLITSGSSSVICAWELSVDKDRPACLSLKQLLFGHTRPVTCLAASASYSILVSGSADRSCLVWDLNRLTRITRLPAHKACLSAVAINDSTGDIASCAGGTLYLWNINGQPLAEVCATLSAGVHLSCCCFSQVKDWDVRSLVVTGDTAGNVQVASRELWGELLLLGTQTTMQSQSPIGRPLSWGPWVGPPTLWGKPFVLSRELDLSMASSERRSKTMPAITALAVSRPGLQWAASGASWGPHSMFS
uniref:Uncharacterized protein n=1 Tax=Varanus komodoensis TaxID=61221 RepID=A0A8D2L5L1_VARKO